MSVIEEHMEILVHCGVHGRVAVTLAEVARDNNVDLQIESGDRQVNCSSILELLSLALVQGSRITVRVEGEQAERALRAVKILLMEEKTA
jgi:phosphotransferase system HPr (HPr) family protein